MKIYCVGGAVRDELLGLTVQDRDWVVVGATPEDMERLGYKAVGKDFPVFLHPQTHEEYALARTERKVARGYKGFSVYAAPDVTLEQDLARRDLTINAMAREAGEGGALIDPHGGKRDLEAKLLRHVGEAFVEDPVRILRVARFAARFDFAVAPETLALMRRMVAEGETDALVSERVWQEFSRGLMQAHAPRMFEVLAACGLLPKLLPELALAFADDDAPADEGTRHWMHALGRAASHPEGQPLEVRFALLAFALRDGDKAGEARALAERLRASNECRDALVLAAARGEAVRRLDGASDPEQVLALLEAADAFRRPERLRLLLAACEAMDAGEGASTLAYAPAEVARTALRAAAAVDAAAIAAKGGDIGVAVRAARLQAIRAVLS